MPPQAADQRGDSPESLRTDNAAPTHLIVASNRRSTSPARYSGELDSVSSVALTGQNSPQSVTEISIASTPEERAAAGRAENGLITDGLPAGSAFRLITPSRRAFHRFYNVICNPLLWFVHHRSWGFTHTPNIDREAHTAWEQGFVNVSRMFSEEIAIEASRLNRPTTVLLRDYHMHLVGGMIRELLPESEIRYVPDVPWPDPADWMMLPARWRDDIFRSLLACNSVELPSKRDVRSLLRCFDEFLPDAVLDQNSWQVSTPDGRKLQLKFRHPEVDENATLAVADSNRCETYIERFSRDDRYTFVTTERTEPHKNIVRCIRAFGTLLNEDRELAEETRYLIVLAPPPPHLSQYRRYLSEIEKAAGDVNSRHRTQVGKPVELIVENNYPMALAAMSIADTLIAVPIADANCATQLGTPLVNRNDCTLIFSETSTAAEIFGDTAVLVAPSDVEAIKQEMLHAFELPDDQREERFSRVEAIARERAGRPKPQINENS